MNPKVYRNQAKLMNASSRKRMYKKGKQWIVASSLFLSLLAGGSLLGIHADSVQPQAKASTQTSNLNRNQVSTQDQHQQAQVPAQNNQAQQKVSTQAANLHNHLLNNSNNTYNKGMSKLANLQANSRQQLHNQFKQNNTRHGLNLTTTKPTTTEDGNNQQNDLEGIAFVGAKFEYNNNQKTNNLDITHNDVGTPFYEDVKSGSNNGISANQLASLVPNGWELAPSSVSGQTTVANLNNKDINVSSLENVNYQDFNDGLDDATNKEHLIPVVSTAKDHIDVEENPVDIEGTVYLNIPNHAPIELPYSIQAKTNSDVNVLNFTNPKANEPSDYAEYLDQYFNQSSYNKRNVTGFSFDNRNYSEYTFNLNPSDFNIGITTDNYQNGTRLLHKDVELNFIQNKATENINYIYHGNLIKDKNNNTILDKKGGIQGELENAPTPNSELSDAGYYVPDNSTFTFSDNGTADIPVLPKSAHAEIEFVNPQGSQVSTTISDYSGNDNRASLASNTSMPVSHINPNDIPEGYHIAASTSNSAVGLNGSILFNNDKGSSANVTKVAVVPNTATDNIIYEDKNGRILGEFRSSGSTATSNLAINSNSASNESLPTGYVLSNGENFNFKYDGGTHVVQLSGSSVKDNYTINVSADGSKLTSNTKRGTLTSVGDSITINPANYAPATNYLPTNSDQLTTIYVNSDGHLTNTGNSNLLGAADNTITLNYKELKGINGKNGTNGKNGANGKNGNFSLPNIITVNYKNQLGQVVKTGYITNASGVTNDLISDVTVPSDYQISNQPVSDYDQRTNISKPLPVNNNKLNFTADNDPHEITIYVSGMTGSQIASNEDASTSSSESSATNSANIIINGLNSAITSASTALSKEAAKDDNSAASNQKDLTYQKLLKELNSLKATSPQNASAISSAKSAMNSEAGSNDSAYQSLSNALNSLENRVGYNKSVISSANSTSASASETIHGLSSAESNAKSLASSAENAASGKDKSNPSASSADNSTESSANSVATKDSEFIVYLDSIITSASTEASLDSSNMTSASKSVATDSKAVTNDENKAKTDSGNSSVESNDQKAISSANSTLASEKAVSGSASSDDSYAKSVIDSATNLINGASNAFNSLNSQYAFASSAKNHSEMNKFSSEMKSADAAVKSAESAATNASNIASSAENALSGLTSASTSASNAASSANAALTSASKAFSQASVNRSNAIRYSANPTAMSTANSAYSSASNAQASASAAAASANSASNSATSASNSESTVSSVDSAATKANQQNSTLAANDSSADSAFTSASSALSSAKFASTSASYALSSANSASNKANHDNNASEKSSASTAVLNANSASTSASKAVTSASLNNTAASNTASSADSLAASNIVNFDPYTYITIIEQENGQPVRSYAQLIREDSTQMGSTFIIKPSDSGIEPSGFTPDNSNQSIVGTITAKGISLLSGTDTFVYDADDAKLDEATQTGNPSDQNIIPIYNQSKNNIPAKSQVISGAKNQKLSNNQAPYGYQFDPKYEYHFNDQGQLVGIKFNSKTNKPETNPDGTPVFNPVTQLHVIGNKVNGKANIILKYIVKNANGSNTDTIIHKADDAQVVLNGRVGDTVHFNPWKYFKDNYNVPSDQSFTIPSDAVNAQYDYGQQYNPNLEFDYYANQAAPIKVEYRNADVKDGDGNNQLISTNDKPINIKGIAGETVYLSSASDTSDSEPNHYNVLNIPDGYYLAGNSVRVVLKPATIETVNGKPLLKPLIMTVNLHLGHTNEQQAIDTINFNGDPIANTDEIGSYGETGSIDAPVGYHFTNGSNGTFTFSNQTHNFDVEPNDPTRTDNNVVNYNLPNGASMKSFINTINGKNNTSNSDTPTGNGQSIINNIHTPKANSNEAITKIAKHLKQGQSIVVNTKNGKLTINSKRTSTHYRWLYVIKPILLHRNIDAIGSNRDAIKAIKPKHKFYARIIGIYKLMGHGRNFTRYEISVKISKYYRHVFVTGNPEFVRNAYYQLANLHHAKKFHHKYYKARIIAPAFEYKGRFYTRRTRQHLMRVGKIVHISRIVRIGRKGDKQTKFELTNGHYITANKNFIKLV